MTVDDFLTRSASRFSTKPAVICGDQRTSYGALDEASNRLAHALIDGGVRRGDRVAVFLDNSVDAVVSIFGVLKAGSVFVVVNPTTKTGKLGFILNDCSVTAVILGVNNHESHIQAITNAKSIRCVVVCGDSGSSKITSPPVIHFEKDLPAFSSNCPETRSVDVDLAALVYTSGSTGLPRGVALSHRNVVSAATSVTAYLGNVADDVIINVLPLSFDYGLSQLLTSVMIGATLVLEKTFAYPFKTVERIQEEQVTGFPGVPTIFALLLQMRDIEPERLDSVRYVTNTSATLPPAYISKLGNLFRNARIFSMYGLTECKRVSYLDPKELDRRPTSVGKPMPNVDAFVVDEHGNEVQPGEVGELLVRGSNVMMGYWNQPEETAKTIRQGRYPWERVLHTDDLFTVDEEGYLYFVSRKDDIIKSRGEKVSPVEVEGVIHDLPGIREAVVVGVDDPILGQAIKAFVVREEGSDITEQEIMRHCASTLENFMVPKSIEFRDTLPTTDTGKVLRKALQESAGSSAKQGV